MRNQAVSHEEWLKRRLEPLPVEKEFTRQPETAGTRAGTSGAAALGAADWLSLAAAPTFAVMALVTGVLGSSAADTVCTTAATPHTSPLTGMAAMYMLMSAFHSAPWLKLVARRRRPA